MLKTVHLIGESGADVFDLKIPYQIFGDSLSTVTILTLRGYKVSPAQTKALFDNLKAGQMCLKELELDSNVHIGNISEADFTKVINSLSVVKFIGTIISGKQLTDLLTTVLNNGK